MRVAGQTQELHLDFHGGMDVNNDSGSTPLTPASRPSTRERRRGRPKALMRELLEQTLAGDPKAR